MLRPLRRPKTSAGPNQRSSQAPHSAIRPLHRVFFGDGFGGMTEKGSEQKACENCEHKQERVSGRHHLCRGQHDGHEYKHPEQRGMSDLPQQEDSSYWLLPGIGLSGCLPDPLALVIPAEGIECKTNRRRTLSLI